MTYEFRGTAEAIAFEDTVAAMRVITRRGDRPIYRDGRVVRVPTVSRADFDKVVEEARRLGGEEYVGVPACDRF